MSRRRRSNQDRYIFAPWVEDETLYPVGRIIDDELMLRWYKRREFPNSVYTSKFNKQFLNRENTGWRCFISGAQCYFMKRTNGLSIKKIPFVTSLDHLVPMRDHRGPEISLAHRLRNQTIAAAVNKNVGHIPLALKILHRHELRNIDYDREKPTWETFLTIKEHIIQIENQFMHLGKYPWQPWSYSEGSRAAADAFMVEMEIFDNEFLSIDTQPERQKFVDTFRWKW